MSSSKIKKFKLVLGLGNNSLEQISLICQIYALAGADIFDLSPNKMSLKAARDGVLKAGLNPEDFKFCISLGLKGDKHIKKAFINQKKCKKCLKCLDICAQEAIFNDEGTVKVDESKCIGCMQCKKECIEFYDRETDIIKTIKKLKDEKIDMVELHISTDKKSDILKNWELILKHFDCPKSICIDRSRYGDEELKKLIQKLISRNPKKTIIQADGVAMSGVGGNSSSLQAIAHAALYKNLDAEIFISGGVNNLTKKLAENFEIRFDGLTMGSYARQAVKGLEVEKAVKIAKELVNSVKK